MLPPETRLSSYSRTRIVSDDWSSGDLVVEPLDDPDITPAGVDLSPRKGVPRVPARQHLLYPPEPRNEVSEYVRETHVPEGDDFILHPGDFVLGTTHERVEIPADLIAHVEGRSSLGRLAIVVHATAGLVDPGYEGQITLELSNLGTAPVALTPGMRISQLVFTEMKSPADRPYGVERGSKYQGQRGPQASRLSSDPEFGGDE